VVSTGSFVRDERNVVTYNDQPVKFILLPMNDIIFSTNDIHELKMVMMCVLMYYRCCCIVVAL